ncbi:MAG: winged helix-turn-helix domain-containing protein [Nitrososphaera sp.]|jgi:predicted transcriptional regulator
MSRAQYRTEIGIVSQILSITMEHGRSGTIISHIARAANLSHGVTVEKCQKLIGFGLIESINNRRNQHYSITEKGIQFYHEMQKFIDVVQELKIRC